MVNENVGHGGILMTKANTIDNADYGAYEIMELDGSKVAALVSQAEDSKGILSNGVLLPMPIPGDDKRYYRGYVPCGNK